MKKLTLLNYDNLKIYYVNLNFFFKSDNFFNLNSIDLFSNLKVLKKILNFVMLANVYLAKKTLWR